jgi:hypothetical protein
MGQQTNTALPLSGMQRSLEAYHILGLNGTRDLNWVGDWGLKLFMDVCLFFVSPLECAKIARIFFLKLPYLDNSFQQSPRYSNILKRFYSPL